MGYLTDKPAPKKPVKKPEGRRAPTLKTERSWGEKFWDDVGAAATDSFAGSVVRKVADWTDWKKAPGETEEQHDRRIAASRKQILAENDRKNAAEPVFRKGDPLGNAGRAVSRLGAGVIGGASPTYLIGGPAASAAGRLATQGVVNAAEGAATQGAQILEGSRDEFDAEQVKMDAALGVLFQGGAEGIGKAARSLRGRPAAEAAPEPEGLVGGVTYEGPMPRQPDEPLDGRQMEQMGDAPRNDNEPGPTGEWNRPTDIGEFRQKKELGAFANTLREQIREKQISLQEAASALREQGAMPLEVGARLLTPKARENGLGPWRVLGHYVDGKKPDRYGYYVERGTPDGPDYERTILLTSDPEADARLRERNPEWDREAEINSYVQMDGPRPVARQADEPIEGGQMEQAMDGPDPNETGPTGEWKPGPDVNTRREQIKAATAKLDETAPDSTQSVRPFPEDEPDYYRFRHKTADGKEVGGTYYIDENGDIGGFSINGEGARTSDVKTIRRINDDLAEQHPNANWIHAERIKGANPGRSMSVRIKRKERPPVGSIGPKQGIIPEELQPIPNPEKTARSKEDTRAAGDEIEKLQSIGDVSAMAAKGQAEVQMAGADLMRAVDEFGPQSDEYLEALTNFLNVTATHSKNSGELGRGLNILNKDGLSPAEAQRIAELASNPVEAQRFAELVRKYADDPDALKKIARDAVNPTLRDHIFSWRYNLMLSAPGTHVYNIAGSASNIMMDIASKGLASVLGVGKKLTGNTDRVTGREVAARMQGLWYGMRASAPHIKTAFLEGRPSDDASRADMTRGRVGRWELPIKAMAAEDEFFRSAANVSSVYGLAVRHAVGEGLTGDALKLRIQQLTERALLPKKSLVEMKIKDETADLIRKESRDYAKRMRFQDDPSFLGKWIEQARQRKKGDTPLTAAGKDLMALTFPFVRTPDSLARTALRYSPLGVLEGKNWEDFRAGGARRDTAIARITLGTAITSFAAAQVLDGTITGEGPRDFRKRQRLEQQGWQPNSFFYDGKYYSYEGMEPWAYILSGVATTVERFDEGSDKDFIDQAALQTANAIEVLMNSSWLESGDALWSALTAPEGQRAGAVNNFIANVAASFTVPAAVRQVNQSYVDPVVRDTRGDDSLTDRVTGRIQSGIPGLSDNLPAQHDALGRELQRGDAIGPDILSRMRSTERVGGEGDEAVAAELQRLENATGKYPISAVDRTIDTKDFPLGRLNAEDHQAYQELTGIYISQGMQELMASPDYQGMDDTGKLKAVKKLQTQARKWAQEDIFTSDGSDITAAEEGGIVPTAQAADIEGEEFTLGQPTSMRRTEAGNRAVGGVENSAHLSGDGIDFVPSPGVSWQELYNGAREFFGPDAKVLWENRGTSKEHIHVEMPGLDAPLYGDRGTQ